MNKKYKVLIVEDDELIRSIYSENLSLDSDIQVDLAVDGLDGLNKIKQNKYDLIFSGIQMPNKTGFELYQDLQSNSDLAKIPFVIFSHLGRPEDMQKARDLNIRHFIIRGNTTPDQVSRKIKEVLLSQDFFINQEGTNISQYKVLIIEDDPEIRSIYIDRFSQHPSLIVDSAVDGLDGLNKIKENEYDLVFSGIQMPNKTGFELYQEVQELENKKNTLIVLFSHWGRTEDLEYAKRLGVKYFIIRGHNSPNDTLNQILDILNAKDKVYRLNIKKDSLDYYRFLEAFLGNEPLAYQNTDTIPVKITLSQDSKPYTFFIELDSDNK
jgi:CheY-like chemotaxis protein